MSRSAPGASAEVNGSRAQLDFIGIVGDFVREIRGRRTGVPEITLRSRLDRDLGIDSPAVPS